MSPCLLRNLGVVLSCFMVAVGCGSDESDAVGEPGRSANYGIQDPDNNTKSPDGVGDTVGMETGILELTVEGLEVVDGVYTHPDVVVSGNGMVKQVSDTGVTSMELPAGNYQVTGNEVTNGPARFQAPSRAIEIGAGESTSQRIVYEVLRGSLVVGYEDHPEPSQFQAEVVGPAFSEKVNEETMWIDLTPGTYHVGFPSYTDGEVVWDATLDGEEIVVESEANEQVLTGYEIQAGKMEVTMDIPEGVIVDYWIVDSEGQVVHSFTEEGSGLEIVELVPGEYELVVDTEPDEWNNLFYFDGVEKSLPIVSGQTYAQTVSTQLPSEVTITDDDGDQYGSLREVVDRVKPGTEIQFGSEISTIELDTSVVIDRSMRLMGPNDGYVSITQSEDNEGDSLFEVDYEEVDTGVIHFEGIEFFNGEAFRGPGINGSGLAHATLQVFDCKFNGLKSSSLGGAIYVPSAGGSVHVVGSHFNDNVGARGGAIYFSHVLGGGGELVVEDSHFHSNEASASGGAIRAFRGGVTVDNSYFYSNEASTSGGAIALGGDTTAWIANSEFVENSSDSDGGAIKSSGDLSADNILVEGNEASGDGGGIMLAESAGAVTSSVFYGNHASELGGALRLDEVGAGMSNPFEIRSVLIEQNQSMRGGALYMGGDEITRTHITNATIIDNEMTDGLTASVEWSNRANGVIQFSTISGALGCNASYSTCFDILPGVRVREDAGAVLMRAVVIDTSIASLSIEDTFLPVQSEGYNVFNNGVGGVGEFVSSPGDELDAVLDLSWSENYSDSPGTDSLNRVARLEASSIGYRDIPPEMCEEITSISLVVSDEERLLKSDQRGMARPSGAYCSSGAWEPDSHFEDFAGVDLGDSPGSGSFTGNDDRSWDYSDAYSDFDDDRIILDQEGASMSSTEIESLVSGADGVDSMAIIYEAEGPQSDGDRQVRVRADGTVLGTSDNFSSDGGVLVIDDFQDFQDGDGFELEIENNAPGVDGAIAIKQVVWR